VHAVLFDLDDTLMAHREAVAEALLARMRALGHPYDTSDADAEVAYWRTLEERHYHRYLGGEIDYAEQRRQRARDFAIRHGVALGGEEQERWFADYAERYVTAWRRYDDVLPCLAELHRRIPDVRLGLITNGEARQQLRKLDAIGLRDSFDTIVASGEVGVTKPDARIFEMACARLGVEPRQAAYVGDRWGTDAAGAARAGLTGVWLDRYGDPVTDDERAAAADLDVARITTLAQLPGLLG
jgi:putative hydrolase of the HAD superfamily